MNVIIGICLGIMLLIILSTIFVIIKLNRADRLNYLKKFRKGKFALIYFATLPLFFVGLKYGGNSVPVAIFESIKNAVDLVVLKFDYAAVELLMSENVFYLIAMYAGYVLVCINAFLFTFTLFVRRVYNIAKVKSITFSKKKVFIVVGLNSQNKQIIESIDKNDANVILLNEFDSEAFDYAYINKIALVRFSASEDLGEACKKIFKSFEQRVVNLIINTGNDTQNLLYTEQISDVIATINVQKLSISDMRGINCYVFGEPLNASTFIHFVEKTKGAVHYLNKYKLIAMDFVDKYPITQFMDKEQIDYASATVKDELAINVVMIGFGKTNKQIFLTSVENNQLMTKAKNSLCEKPINYWIYDQKLARNDKILNHNYFRFEKTTFDQEEYFPLPKKPANVKFEQKNINDENFYTSIKENLSYNEKSKENKDLYNYVVIAFGSDLENIDLAEKLMTKLKEWQLFEKTKVFVKIRNQLLSKEVVETEYASSENFYTFGNEKSVVYNSKNIVGEKKELMARFRHLSYAIEDEKENLTLQTVLENANKKWFKSWVQVQRESNVYACLSIRLKLQLLGFDYAEKSNSISPANDEYMKAYQLKDEIKYDQAEKVLDIQKQALSDKKKVKYTIDFVEGSVRQTLAKLEHQRWNAYMITCGYIPAKKDVVLKSGAKQFDVRQHGNITTFDGLVDFRKQMAKNNKTSEESCDVIKYDYQLMDDLVWLLSKLDYQIIKRA